MSYVSLSEDHKFQYPYDTVFESILKVLPENKFKITDVDRSLGWIKAKAPDAIWKWGTYVRIGVERLDDGATRVKVRSHLISALDWGSATNHPKNIEMILKTLDQQLKTIETC